MKSILLVDDELKLLRILSSSLKKKGYQVHTATNGQSARKMLSEERIDVVFLDIMLPDTTGLILLEEFIPLYPNKLFVMMTAYSDVQNAVTAVKTGAFDYLVKPTQLDELLLCLDKAYEWLGIKQENKILKEKLRGVESSLDSLDSTPGMKHLAPLIERVAGTEASVLLEGESGTGKSMVAMLIHKLSDRSEAPFISINCAAIPEQLLESELFGYKKGAFTGATADHEGKFEAAHSGTIFLDEIGEINASLQAKLLQVVQEKSFMRLGSNQLQEVDVRIISATNRKLKQMVDSGQFREDLYYRLNIVDIEIPPLRERREDIPLLIEGFLERHRQQKNRPYQISAELVGVLCEYPWPGNVRELENSIERAVVLCQSEKISILDFPKKISESREESIDLEMPQLEAGKTLPELFEELEKRYIVQALEENNGKAAMAARKLGISRQSLLYKMNKYCIS